MTNDHQVIGAVKCHAKGEDLRSRVNSQQKSAVEGTQQYNACGRLLTLGEQFIALLRAIMHSFLPC